jgi:hypothetical protein
MNPTPSPGRVVATLYDGEADRGHASSPPIDTHVYDEWTAEAEAEARELLGPELAVQADDGGSLEAELPPVPTRSEGSTRTQWLLVGALGLLGAAMVVAGGVAGFGALTLGAVALW